MGQICGQESVVVARRAMGGGIGGCNPAVEGGAGTAVHAAERSGVDVPGQVLGSIHTQELGAAQPLHCSAVGGQLRILGLLYPEVHDDLHNRVELVIPAPCGQVAHSCGLSHRCC